MRTWYVLGAIIVIAIGIGVFLSYFGPASLESDVNGALATNGITSVQYTVLAQGDDALSISERSNYRLMTSDELTALWPMIYGDNNGPALPNIDFTKYEVLAVFDGSHSTGGYGIAIESLTDGNGVRTVVIDHRSPGPNCPTLGNPTSPFEIIQVPITTLPLAHQDIMSTTSCP